MLKNGIDVHTVSRRLGHAKTSVKLDIYAHEIPGSQDKATALMDEINTPVSLPPDLIAPSEFIARQLHVKIYLNRKSLRRNRLFLVKMRFPEGNFPIFKE